MKFDNFRFKIINYFYWFLYRILTNKIKVLPKQFHHLTHIHTLKEREFLNHYNNHFHFLISKKKNFIYLTKVISNIISTIRKFFECRTTSSGQETAEKKSLKSAKQRASSCFPSRVNKARFDKPTLQFSILISTAARRRFWFIFLLNE